MAVLSTSPTRLPALGTRAMFGKGAGKSGLALGLGRSRRRAGDVSRIFRCAHTRLAGLGGKRALVDTLGNIAQRSLGFLGHLIPLSAAFGAAL